MKESTAFLLLLLLASCSAEKIKQQVDNIQIDLDKSKVLSFSEQFESIEYLLLAPPETAPMVNPYLVAFFQEHIVILDNVLYDVFVFNLSGDFITRIDSKGKGPGEFIHATDLQFREDTILIKDNVLKKIIAFDFVGNFRFELKEDLQSTSFYWGEQHTIHFMDNYVDTKNFNFITKVKNGNSSYSYPIKTGFEGIGFWSNTGFMPDPQSKEIYFNVPFSYDIAVFGLDGEMNRVIHFDFGPSSLSDDVRIMLAGKGSDLRNKVVTENKVEMISAFLPFRDKFFVFLERGERERQMVFLTKDFEVIKQANSFKNDIDGMRFRSIPWTFHENNIVLKMRSSDFLNDYLSFEETMRENFPKAGIHSFIETNQAKLREDNLVLIKWRLKG